MSKSKSKLKTVLMVNAFAFGSMHAINKSISASALLKNILKTRTGNYYKWKFGDVFYTKEGEGAPLLLIHELDPFSSNYEWSLLLDELKKNHTVYSIDLPGCGRSAKPGITYTNYLYVQLLSDFIRDEIGEQTDVLCTGLSSSLVLMTAFAEKDLIREITLINPCSLKKLEQIPDDKSKIIQTIMSIPILGTTLYYMKSSRSSIEYAITEKCFYNPFHAQSKMVDAYYESAHYHHGNGKFLMASLDGCYLNVNIRRILPSLEQKITIIYGDKLENEREIVQGYKELKETITVKVIRGAKLLPQLEMPKEVLSYLK